MVLDISENCSGLSKYVPLLSRKCLLCNSSQFKLSSIYNCRALCRIKLLPVTHVLVDIWLLTVKPVYKLFNVSDDLKWTTNTHVTPFSLTFNA